MELSLRNNDDHNSASSNSKAKNTTPSSNTSMITLTEKEHMFDKVVTPSDVGKLNRLVIPKQHAEKYFPLDSSSNEKGLLLNFEDRNGNSWRFRYSYWNSSQSYVMTRGWSRFVKEKKLQAGDIVSFRRGVGDQDRHRLFIDWRRGASVVNVTQPNLHYSEFAPVTGHTDFRWGNQFICSLPHLQAYGSYQPGPYGYVRPTGGVVGVDDVAVPMLIDSVPVVEGRTVGKRLRLFGVNMDCPVMPSSCNSRSSCGEELELKESSLVGLPTTRGLISTHHLDATSSPSFSSSTLNVGDGSTTLELRLPMRSGSSNSSGACGVLPMATTQSHELSKKGKTNSLSFDLDL